MLVGLFADFLHAVFDIKIIHNKKHDMSLHSNSTAHLVKENIRNISRAIDWNINWK